MNKGTGDIEISFHDDMFPFLLNLQQHLENDGHYFTTYKLQNITLMKHRYSPRIYEILKSYQFNNKKWTFENGTGTKYDLQRMIGDCILGDGVNGEPTIPESWKNWAVFKRDVLDKAVMEINKYTDIKVAYDEYEALSLLMITEDNNDDNRKLAEEMVNEKIKAALVNEIEKFIIDVVEKIFPTSFFMAIKKISHS